MNLTFDLVRAVEPESRRLMVVLHGLGDSLDGYRWLPETLGFPWLNFLLVNGPDAYYGGYSWFDLDGNTAAGIRRSRQLLFELLDDQRQRGFAMDQTMLFGFSQGCLMVLEVGARYPHRFAGCVGISGFIENPEALLRERSPVAGQQVFLITHGTHDPLLPLSMVQPQMEKLRAGGLNLIWREFDKEHTIAGEEELTVIRDFVRSGYPASR